MIREILLWFVFVLFAFGVVSRLYLVSKGIHQRTEDPLINAIAAVINAVLLVLWWIYVLH